MTKYRLSVCPHDTAKNSVVWFFLNTYLQRQLGCGIHFEPKDNFIQERDDVVKGDFHVVYANPFSAGVFGRQLGFIPVARPVGVFDETVLVGPANQPVPRQGPIRIASATDKLIIHGLGLSLLPTLGIALSDCVFEYVGTHVKAAQAVIQGKADLGFVFNETWNGLGHSTLQSLTVISQTGNRQAFHCFCISPQWSDRRDQVQAVLCGMKDDPKGKQILDDLKFPDGFEAVNAADLDAVLQLIDASRPA